VAGTRRAKDGVSGIARVDRVEVLEPGNPELEKFRDAYGKLYFHDLTATRHPSYSVTGLLVHNCLRSFGSKTYQTFLPLFDRVPYKFVATATPSPNRLKELIHYAGFLGIMDTGQALTRFFKRDSTKAGNLTLHEHKAREFWLWVSTWAVFIQKPSDLGYSDDGYILPPLDIHRHRLPVDHSAAGFDSWGQGKLIRNAAASLSDAAREKRDSLHARVQRAKEIIEDAGPDRHWIIWHELEDERRAIEEAIPGVECISGSQDLDKREAIVERFQDGRLRLFGTKPSLSGYGSNFQRHCYSNIFLSLDHKFADFIQSIYRTQRFGQERRVEAHLIYTEAEDPIYDELMRKWHQHDELQGTMAGIIRDCGLSQKTAIGQMRRAIGIERREVKSEHFTAVNNDCVLETRQMADSQVDLIITSIPFGNHYEYCESYNDFGHNDDNDRFFEQMDYLTPELLRVLKPGRMACIHVKDRLRYGSVTGLGMYSVDRFSDKTADHFERHGFICCGRITVTTDVVRENNQTYRLGWTEQCKDGTKMGVGSPEYVLLFRRLPTDTSTSYADVPVVKSKQEYTRARWQFDAHSFWRSNGNRFLRPEEIRELPMDQLRTLWRRFNATHVYDFREHVSLAEELERNGTPPASFMALEPVSHSELVWDDVARMRTLNTEQARNRVEGHVCPLPLDLVDRLVERYSNRGEVIYDPFAGLFTVPYVAVLMGRRGYGCELNTDYWRDGVGYCRAAEQKMSTPTLFDLLASMEAGDAA
jgi:DNA modification methylase